MHRTAFRNKREGVKPWRVASASGLSLLLLFGQTVPLLGNPTGGEVVAGSATIGAAGPTLTINQSTQSAIINWQQFSIANGEQTKFIVPNSASATLNRVVGGNPSAIYGSLQSNGILYLVNPSGIVVGPSGRIDTAAFLASTFDISNEQFLKGGDLNFAGASDAAIHNAGIIHAASGDVYLIANQVDNSGTISAPEGTVGLAAGSDILFQQAGNQHLFVQATPAGAKRATGVTNTGTIRAAAAELKAAGGNAYALAINNTGVIAATGYKKVNGQVYLTSDGGSISNSGKISAQQANGNGGAIAIDGTAVASGTSGTVTNSGTLDASATVVGGKGGTVTLKNMKGKTVHSGVIVAKGGQGGSGGNAEVSGAKVGFTGTVDLTAPGGTTGNLLLDPTTFTVAASGGDETGAAVSATLATANLTLNADSNVTINDAITWTAATTLTLSTNTSGSSSIDLSAPISGVNGGLTIQTAGATDPVLANSSVDVASFIFKSGTWLQNQANLPTFIASTDFELQGGNFVRFAGGSGTGASPYQIVDVYGLQGLASPRGGLLGATASLANNIDASGTATWNSGAGFVPIGTGSSSYLGIFNGLGNTVDKLTINLPTVNQVGLFGYISTGMVENVGMRNANVTGLSNVGALVGFSNNATVSNSYSNGTVSSPSSGGDETGGLVGGMNLSTLSNNYSTATVTGGAVVGGLLGVCNSGIVQNCYATGNVTGNAEVGGLIGSSLGTLSNSYSSGAVSGTTNVGGLMGLIFNGTITNSFWDTTTSGQPLGVGTGGTTGTTGLPTATLMTAATFSGAGWNIGTDPTINTWVILDGMTRPLLGMEYSTNIHNAHQLQLIDLNAATLAASYTVANHVDLSGTTAPSDVWGTSLTNGGAGFVPIGNNTTPFAGTFDGQGNKVSGLYINTPSNSYVGLFGETQGTLENVALLNAEVIGDTKVGGLVGLISSLGAIVNDFSTGMVNGNSDVGGLVGYNMGAVSNAYSLASVSGNGTSDSVGGLVGFNSGSINTSYSSGAVSGFNYVGGLVGQNFTGTINNVYSTGSVSGASQIGGLAGYNSGNMGTSYSSGAVSATTTTNVGGLVGYNAATVNNSFWDTATSGQGTGIGGGTVAGAIGSTTTSGTNNLLALSNYAGAGWNIGTTPASNTWLIFDGMTRPLLSMEYSGTIYNAHQLQLIGLNSATVGASYTLAQNIDASGTTNSSDIWGTSTTNGGAGFVPIGVTAGSFAGTFNGLGRTVDGLYVDSPTNQFVGLFGITSAATIENVGVTNVHVSGPNYAGGLVGFMSNGSVLNSYSTGTVASTGGGNFGTGGLAGADVSGRIVASYSTASVTGQDPVGGLVGISEGTILDSYSTGPVAGNSLLGGLVGEDASGTIGNSYSTSSLTVLSGGAGFDVGGLAGLASSSAISNSFWDTDTAGNTVVSGVGSDATPNTTAGVTAATTAQLESQSFITAHAPTSPTFDFATVWTTNGDTTTPQLTGLPASGPPSGGPTIDTLSGTAFSDSGITFSPNVTIELLAGGSVIGSTTTSNTGTFSFNISSAVITGGILLTDATDAGNTFYQANTPALTIGGINLWGSTLRTMGDTASTAALAQAAGSLSGAGVNYTVNGTFLSTNAGVNLNILSNYALDGVVAANDIAVNSAITSSSSGLSVLIAGRNVTVNAGITNTNGGGITLRAGNSGSGVGTVAFNNGAQISTSGNVDIIYNPSVNPAGSSVNATSYVGPTEDFSGNVTGGTLTSYLLVNTLNDLQNMQNNLSANYALSQDIDASATSGWNNGAGFVPIGTSSPYTGIFNGLGNTIGNLFINLPGNSAVGLFSVATNLLENVNLTGVHVTGGSYVGGLAGATGNTISATITTGIVQNCSSSGTIIGGGNYIGGLVGLDHGTLIVGSYSAGSVSGSGFVGGLTGSEGSQISDDYSTASVSGGGPVGGLVGENYFGGSIHNAYSVGAVSGGSEVGGLVGRNLATIDNSFWDTTTSGQSVGVGNGSATGVTAATTTQLETQSFITANATTSPTFDFLTVWTTNDDTTTPQLIGLPQTSVPSNTNDILSGTAFSDGGLTFSAGVLIDLISGGSVLGSTTTSGTGTFSFTINSAAITSGILLTDATDGGNTYYQANSPASSITGIDLWGSTIRVVADTASNAALGQAVGNLSGQGIQYALTNAAINTAAGENFSILSHYTLDGNITAATTGAFGTDAASVLDGSANVTLTGSSVALAGTFNRTGSLTVTSTTTDITLSSVGTSGSPATATGVTLNSARAVLLDHTVLALGSGGFSATGTGYTSAIDANGEANGINLFDTTITSLGGNISLTGTGGYTGNGNAGLSAGLGVAIGTDGEAPALIGTTGSGNLTITGTFNQTITSQTLIGAVDIYDNNSGSANTLSVADGALSIVGHVTNGTAQNLITPNLGKVTGVTVSDGTVISSTGIGSVSIVGTTANATASDSNLAVEIGGSSHTARIAAAAGSIYVSGTVSSGNAGLGTAGIVINEGSQIIASGTGGTIGATAQGDVTLVGDTTGSSAQSLNGGVFIDGAGTSISASGIVADAHGGAGLTITGTSSQINGTTGATINQNDGAGGLFLEPMTVGIAVINGASIGSTGSAQVTLNGTGGLNANTLDSSNNFTSAANGGTSASYGVAVFSPVAGETTNITSGGLLSVTGQAGSSPTTGVGVMIGGPSNVAAVVLSSGAAVTITGTGGAGNTTGPVPNAGVGIFNPGNNSGSVNVAAHGGNVLITGTSGGGNNSTGIDGAPYFNAVDSSSSFDPFVTATGTVAFVSTAGRIDGSGLAGGITAQSTSFTAPVGTASVVSTGAIAGPLSLNGGDFTVSGFPNGLLTLGASNVTSLVVTNNGGLMLAGAIQSSGLVNLQDTGGDITFGSAGSITATGNANVILAAGTNLASSRYIINNSTAGANAVQVSAGNFYLYSADPASDQFGGITVPAANMIYGAIFSTTGLPAANEELFYVAAAGDVGPNPPTGGGGGSSTGTNPPPSTATGGAADGGSNIVPPVLTTQVGQVFPPTNPIVTGTSNDGSGNGSQPPPFSFVGSGVSTLLGQLDGGLANSGSNSGQVGTGDTAQLGGGQLNNVNNPEAAGTLNEALGPIVYQNLADALRTLGDWANVPDESSDTASTGGEGETILNGGDVAEMTGHGVKSIPLNQAPEQLRNAMQVDVLQGVGSGH